MTDKKGLTPQEKEWVREYLWEYLGKWPKIIGFTSLLGTVGVLAGAALFIYVQAPKWVTDKIAEDEIGLVRARVDTLSDKVQFEEVRLGFFSETVEELEGKVREVNQNVFRLLNSKTNGDIVALNTALDNLQADSSLRGFLITLDSLDTRTSTLEKRAVVGFAFQNSDGDPEKKCPAPFEDRNVARFRKTGNPDREHKGSTLVLCVLNWSN